VGPAWRARSVGTAVNAESAGRTTAAPAAASGTIAAPPNRLAALAPQIALALALAGVTMAAVLVVSLASRPGRRDDTKTPFDATRTEVGALSRLAESSVAQHRELTLERDIRRRAEEDAELKQRLLTQALEEKIRLGRDLHDGIIQSLYAVGLTLESVRGLLRDDPAEVDRRLEQCRAALNSSIRDARTYITGLAPETLRRTGFTRSLQTLLTELQSGSEARFDIKVDDDATALLTSEQTIEALQVARESVSNALRHGKATVVTVRVHKGDREVCLLVQDNGSGFDVASRREGGHGLGNMQARAESIGATLVVTSRPGEGSRMLVNIPILQPATV
jgi:signal transduction histidine kinase